MRPPLGVEVAAALAAVIHFPREELAHPCAQAQYPSEKRKEREERGKREKIEARGIREIRDRSGTIKEREKRKSGEKRETRGKRKGLKSLAAGSSGGGQASRRK